jgi:hypothetical protein
VSAPSRASALRTRACPSPASSARTPQ